jgi:hypothetical protein
MVLVSFQNEFIYTKTEKTAGTSVEIFFEPYCLPPGGYQEVQFRPETVTDYGVVGHRGPDMPSDTIWYNHMPAERIRNYLGHDVWNQFFKFCVVRNPFDKLVSMYFFHRSREEDHPMDRDFSAIRRDFLIWLKGGPFRGDQDKYLIDGSVCVDYFIRFETLFDGLTTVCRKLGIERDAAELGRFKSESRLTDRPFSEFYDREAQGIVAEAYAFELDYFGYRLLE